MVYLFFTPLLYARVLSTRIEPQRRTQRRRLELFSTFGVPTLWALWGVWVRGRGPGEGDISRAAAMEGRFDEAIRYWGCSKVRKSRDRGGDGFCRARKHEKKKKQTPRDDDTTAGRQYMIPIDHESMTHTQGSSRTAIHAGRGAPLVRARSWRAVRRRADWPILRYARRRPTRRRRAVPECV